VGKVYGPTATQFAADAVRLAAADAGIALSQLNGLLVSRGIGQDVHLDLQRSLALRDLALLAEVQAFGATAISMVSLAAMAVQSGAVDMVACVFADAPLPSPGVPATAYGAPQAASGWTGLRAASGVLGATRCMRWPRGATWIASAPPTTISAQSLWPNANGRLSIRGPRCARR
jgi:hypothetical protein